MPGNGEEIGNEEGESGGNGEKKVEDLMSYFSGRGHQHPVSEEGNRLRDTLISAGFDEIQTTYFVPLDEVKELTGHLYPVFKDSIYHLSWMMMEPVPPTLEVEMEVEKRFPDIDRAELWNLLDTIDEDMNGEDLMFLLSKGLGLSYHEAVDLMSLMPELASGRPKRGDTTLRSFMPTSWLSTLDATFDEERLPIRLFTSALSFRREPVTDSRHHRVYNVLSIAIVDRDLTMDRCRGIARKMMDAMEIPEPRMVEKPYPFPYFESGTELEIFGGDLELGTCGMVSRSVLERRGIGADVFILDLGIERILMYKRGYPDIRTLFFPQFHSAWSFTDEEIASSLRYIRQPTSDIGKNIATSIYKAYRGSDPEANRLVAWKGYLRKENGANRLYVSDGNDAAKGEGRPVEVVLKEAKPGMGLTGPGAFDEIYVSDGSILGIPPTEAKRMEETEAIRTKITYVRAFSKLAAWKIEKALDRGQTSKKIEVIKDLEGINLKVGAKTLYFLLSRGKKVDIRGSVYLRFLFRIKENNE